MIGKLVAHYRIVEKLGEGGMGEVYKALDERLHRTVAVKFSKEGFSQRFSREAITIASLNHPNICSLHDIGDFEGAGFLVMEFVEGSRLPSPLPFETALGYAIQIADALDAAHHKGVIHRDLKPANVLVTPSGLVKVLDFGLAKHTPLSPGESQETITATVTAESDLTARGVVVGTAAYMSPEQVEGKPVDARSDIFSFGSVLYELLTGSRAFHGDSVISTLSAVLRDAPVKATHLRKDLPPELERIVERCLEKDRERRYPSVAELRRDLAACLERIRRSHSGFRALLRNRRIAVPAAAVLLAVAGGALWLGIRARRFEWAEKTAVPEIARLADQGDYSQAFALATRAEKIVPGNGGLAKLWPQISVKVSIETEPPGAEVVMKPYSDAAAPWTPAGRTPVSDLRIARGYYRWRFTRSGFETLEYPGPQGSVNLKLRLAREKSPESGMAYVPPGNFSANIAGFGTLGPFPIPEHWIDRLEVTNRKFKQFVDAGGYRNRDFWDQPFVKDGRSLTWEQAMPLLVDATGRPGPSTWEAGTYPDGKDNFPVGGVSWYEAAAYARFAGKSLPTLYHWYHNAQPYFEISSTMAVSNFGRGGPAPAGRYPGLTGTGVYDMAGNVREWCWNEAKGLRYSLGGAWDDPTYFFLWSEMRDPFDRVPGNGFRCVKYAGGSAPPERLAAPVARSFRDYSKEKPVSDESFRIFRSIYSREPRPLNPEVVSEDDSAEHWRKLQVVYDAGYGTERVPAYLFLPKRAAPPYQAVVFFTGVGALQQRSSKSLLYFQYVDFIIKSGRAVLHPIFKGTYERPAGVAPSDYTREQLSGWVNEVSRSADYLDSRPDIQRGAIAYYGFSWGGMLAPFFLPLEERFKTALVVLGGLPLKAFPPECDVFNFVPRVKIPVLMVNGRHDFIFPLETSVQPYYRLLGTPQKDKRLVVLDTGHAFFSKRNDVMRESLDWLDRYLGPVKR